MTKSPSLLRSTGIVSLLTMLSRLLGFIRDLLVARIFGASGIADAFFVAFRIPNLLRSFVAEGALTSAFVPVFSAELHKDETKQAAQRALSAATTLVLCGTTAISLLGIVFAPEIVTLFAPGFADDRAQFTLCTTLTRVMLPFVICVSIVALLNGALNAVKIFGAAAWAQVWMNLTLIAGGLVATTLGDHEAAFWLAGSVLLGGIVQVFVQLPALRRAGLRLAPSSALISPINGEIVRLMLPATIGAAVYQLTIFMSTMLASLLEEGSVSYLFYADRVTQLPVGIFSVALASVLLPLLSRAQVSGDHVDFERQFVNSLRFTSFVIMPAAAGLFCLAEPLTQVLFERGAFSHEATLKTALAIQGLSLGLWATSCHSMVVRTFIARRDTATPTIIGVISLGANVVIALLLIGPLHPGPSAQFFERGVSALQSVMLSGAGGANFSHAGLCLATSAAAGISLILALLLVARTHPTLSLAPFIRASWQSALAILAMGYVLNFSSFFDSPTVTSLSLKIALGGLTYLVVLALQKNREVQETFALFLRLMSRSSNR